MLEVFSPVMGGGGGGSVSFPISAAHGGTGTDTSASTGVASVAAGVWSIGGISGASITSGVVATAQGGLGTSGGAANGYPLFTAGAVTFVPATAFRSYLRYAWTDHFATGVSGSTTPRSAGELMWAANNNALVTTVQSVATHPGIFNLASGVTATNYITLGPAPTDSHQAFLTGDMSYFAAIVRPQTTAAMDFTFGPRDSIGTADETGNGVYFSYQAATSASWRTITRASGTTTANQTAIAYTAGNWYLLEIIKSGTNWQFYINTTLQFTHSTNIDTTTVFSPYFDITDTAATTKTIDIDYFEMRTIDPMNQVWT